MHFTRLLCRFAAKVLPCSPPHPHTQEEIKIPSGPDARRSVGGEIGPACLCISLLKFDSSIWPKVESRCWAACKYCKGEDTGNVLPPHPLTTSSALGAREPGISVAPVMTIHQNQSSQGSRLKTAHVKHQLDKYVAAPPCAAGDRLSNRCTVYFLEPKE